MISGSRIPWNAITICEMTKTSWQTVNLKMNEDSDNPSATCLVREGNFWEEDILIAEIEKKLEKLKRERICISCGRWFSKIIRKRLRIPRTHSETGIHRKERESQRRNREEFQPEKKDDEGINKDFWAHAEARKEFHLSSWYWTEKFKQRAERRIFPYFTSFGLLSETPPRRNFRCGRRNGKKPKHLMRNKCNCIDIAGKYEILHHITTLRTNPFLCKDLKKAVHLIFSEGESKHTLSLGTAYLWDKILQLNLKIRRVRDTLKWEPGKKDVWTPNVVLFSELRGIESYVWFRRLWRSVSQTRMPRETEKHKQKDLSFQAILIPDAKATVEKEWK